jgi:hypothetical protein
LYRNGNKNAPIRLQNGDEVVNWGSNKNGPGVAATTRDPAHRGEKRTVDTSILPKDRPEVLPDETPHGCYEGWVYLGFEGEDENGEPTEEIAPVPCRRCQAAPETL